MPERKKAVIADLQRCFGELVSERLDAIGDRSLTVDEIKGFVEEVGREVGSRLEERLIEDRLPRPRTAPPARAAESGLATRRPVTPGS